MILHFLSMGETKPTLVSWCKSKISCCSKKHSEEEIGLNHPTEENTNLIEQIELTEESKCKCKCKCFNWFKCKKMCTAENSGDDCISLRFVHKQHHLNFNYFLNSTFSSFLVCLLLRFYVIQCGFFIKSFSRLFVTKVIKKIIYISFIIK